MPLAQRRRPLCARVQAGVFLGPLFGRLKGGISSTVDSLIAEGDVVVALASGTAETVDGHAYNNNCQVIRIAEGKFAEVIEYCDTDLLRRTFS